ncbi:hypothetical protein [Arthrobacter sp. B0490]|uniref:hypothetical protein n=1 Tax=Arthrobacter sp. B0490 TaxID=2058891 RepID=UPI000CE4D1ED|nr:hypothetical protein [Arthrobacter sp. B0490]
MSQRRKIALGVGAAALVAGASLGVTGMANATTTATPAPSASASATPGGEVRGGFGRHGSGFDTAALADRLGLEEAAVEEALLTLRGEVPARDDAGARPDPDALQSELAASLAAALGVDEATVQAALAELGAEHQEERSAALQERLDAAVADGSLTREEADGAAKAVELGVIGGHR